MLAWIIRCLLLLAAPIAALFVSRDALNFGVFEMLVAVVLIVGFVLAAAGLYGPPLSLPEECSSIGRAPVSKTGGRGFEPLQPCQDLVAVSYTHLTLPTIYSV